MSNSHQPINVGVSMEEPSKRLLCPNCSRQIPWAHIRRAEAIRCPHCGSKLKIPESYRMWNAAYAFGLAVVFAYAIGVRGAGLFLATLTGWFPIMTAVFWVAHRILPPTLIFSDDYLTDIKNRK
jgi:DNA-directed RNA polymerase subunit RPC12/RpoP